jgi:hypothetical protein
MLKRDSTTEPSDARRIEIILTEYRMRNDEIQMHSNFLLRNNQFLFAMFGAAIGLSFMKGGDVRLDYLPMIVPSMLFLYLMFQFMSMHILTGLTKARKNVEARIFRITGEWLLNWESYIGDTLVRRRFTAGYVAALAFLIFVAGLFIYFAAWAFIDYDVGITVLHATEFSAILASSVAWLRFEFLVSVPQRKPVDD